MSTVVLRRYPAYRESGLPWLGPVPQHWEVRRNGRLFAARRELADADLPILEVSLRTGVRVRGFEEGARKQVMADRSKYQLARAGDLVYNTMRMWQGALGVAPVDGLVSPAYVVARPRAGVDPRYFAYLFRTAVYLQQVDIESRGIVPDRNRLYWDAFKQMPSVAPSADEQRVIAEVLDVHGAAVHRIEQRKRCIQKLLAEQERAAVEHTIRHATKGSGTSSSSEELPLRRVAEVRLSGVDKHSVDGETEVLLCNYTDVYRRGRIDSKIDFMRATASDAEITAFSLRRGDVIITKDSESWTDIAVPALVVEDLPNVVCAYHLALLRPDTRQIDGEFLYRVLTMASVAAALHVQANGVTRFGLSQHAIKSVRIPVPSLEVQRGLCQAVSAAVAPLANARTKVDREIALLAEYRARFVADIVLGRMDVQRAAAQLLELGLGRGDSPEENIAEPLLDDDTDDVLELEQLVEAEL